MCPGAPSTGCVRADAELEPAVDHPRRALVATLPGLHDSFADPMVRCPRGSQYCCCAVGRGGLVDGMGCEDLHLGYSVFCWHLLSMHRCRRFHFVYLYYLRSLRTQGRLLIIQYIAIK